MLCKNSVVHTKESYIKQSVRLKVVHIDEMQNKCMAERNYRIVETTHVDVRQCAIARYTRLQSDVQTLKKQGLKSYMYIWRQRS